MIERKSVACEFKTDKGKPGRFKALFSVTGNVDLDGDRIKSGAFAPAHEADPHPAVVWTHMWNVPPIGETISWGEVDKGAEAEADLFISEHEVAKQVWAGLDSGALKQFSFAFTIQEHSFVEPGENESTPRFDGKIRDIQKIANVYEWGPTLVGANPETELLGGKSLQTLLGLKEFIPSSLLEKATLDLDEVLEAVKSGDLDAAKLLTALTDLALEDDTDGTKTPDPSSVAALLAARPMLHLHS